MRSILTTSDSYAGQADDNYYLQRMKETLEAFPNMGPPLHPTRLSDHVYIGNQRNADDIQLLKRHGITHVLNCAGTRRFDCSKSPYPKDSGIKGYLLLPIEDHEDFNLHVYLNDAISFLDKVKSSRGKALVHCNLGVNRSGAVVAAYLMADQRRTLMEVINYLKLKRFVILCNKGFRLQLIQFARRRKLLDLVIDPSLQTMSSRSKTLPGSIYHNDTSTFHRPEFAVEHNEKNYNGHHNYGRSQSERPYSRISPNMDKKSVTFYPEENISRSKSTSTNINAKYPALEKYSKFNTFLTLPRKSAATKYNQENNTFNSKHESQSSSTNKNPTISLTPAEDQSTCSEASDNISEQIGQQKFGGFLTLLGARKKPLRSTSFSNVSNTTDSNRSADDTSTSSMSRPLRVYTRSSTDSELYRSRLHAHGGYLQAETDSESSGKTQPGHSSKGADDSERVKPKRWLNKSLGKTTD